MSSAEDNSVTGLPRHVQISLSPPPRKVGTPLSADMPALVNVHKLSRYRKQHRVQQNFLLGVFRVNTRLPCSTYSSKTS